MDICVCTFTQVGYCELKQSAILVHTYKNCAVTTSFLHKYLTVYFFLQVKKYTKRQNYISCTYSWSRHDHEQVTSNFSNDMKKTKILKLQYDVKKTLNFVQFQRQPAINISVTYYKMLHLSSGPFSTNVEIIL